MVCLHTNKEVLDAKDATCGETGLTEGLKCSDCDTILTKQEEIPATGEHNYVDGSCNVCGAQDSSQQPDEPESTTPIEAELTFDASKENRIEFSTTKQVWEQNGITFTNNKGSSTSNVADYGGPIRLYAKSGITISAPGKITQIVFNANTSSYATELKNSISGATATVNSKVVTVTFAEPVDTFTIASLSAQVRLDSITVTYEA